MKKEIVNFLKVLVFTFAIFFLIPKVSLAYFDTGIPCNNQAECDEQAPGTKCINGYCAQLTTSSSLEKFQKELNHCAETGETSMECWIGGPNQVSQKPTATTGIIPGIADGITTMIIGTVPSVTEETTYRPGGAIGGINNLIAAMYINRPASSVEYFADLGRNLGIVKPAYAQAGAGFQGLKPILPLWKAFRNIAYLFFTIIFVVIGFAIMFRVKLNPQTVITIQNAIPRIIVALILVTFSYAIAGLMIDLMYVTIGLLATIINSSGLISNATEVTTQLTGEGFSGLAKAMFGSFPEEVWAAFAGIGAVVGLVIGTLTIPIGKLAGAVVGGAAGAALFDLIIAVIILIVLFKILIELIKSYISILLAIIFSPLQIMLNCLPGQNTFGAWLKNLLANIAVFPAVAAFALIARMLIGLDTNALWYPPMVGGAGVVVAGIIGFGMLLLLSKVPQMVKDALKVKPFSYGTAIGEAFGPLKGPAKTAALYPIQYGAQKVETAYQGYQAMGQPIPSSIAKSKAATDVLKTMGKIK